MKTYLEIKVPISFDAPWFCELRKALKDIPVHWQIEYYHITMAFLDDTQHLPEVEAIMHKYLDMAKEVAITFDKLDVFTANNGMQIVYLTTCNIPGDFQKLVDDIRRNIGCTSSNINSAFLLHVTLGRIKEPKTDIHDICLLINDVEFQPFTLKLNEVEYRVFRGRTIYKNTLK